MFSDFGVGNAQGDFSDEVIFLVSCMESVSNRDFMGSEVVIRQNFTPLKIVVLFPINER